MGHGGVSDPCQTVCEQIWRFLKVLGDKSSLKSNPIVRRLFWAIFKGVFRQQMCLSEWRLLTAVRPDPKVFCLLHLLRNFHLF